MMDWYWHVLIHVAAVYYTIGAYLGFRWWDTSKTERLMGAFLMGFVWVFVLETGDSEYFPKRKTQESKTLKSERIRMKKERELETTRVELLEASGEHRQAMAVLHERRRKAEEIL